MISSRSPLLFCSVVAYSKDDKEALKESLQDTLDQPLSSSKEEQNNDLEYNTPSDLSELEREWLEDAEDDALKQAQDAHIQHLQQSERPSLSSSSSGSARATQKVHLPQNKPSPKQRLSASAPVTSLKQSSAHYNVVTPRDELKEAELSASAPLSSLSTALTNSSPRLQDHQQQLQLHQVPLRSPSRTPSTRVEEKGAGKTTEVHNAQREIPQVENQLQFSLKHALPSDTQTLLSPQKKKNKPLEPSQVQRKDTPASKRALYEQLDELQPEQIIQLIEQELAGKVIFATQLTVQWGHFIGSGKPTHRNCVACKKQMGVSNEAVQPHTTGLYCIQNFLLILADFYF
jgi:hypothetical protein